MKKRIGIVGVSGYAGLELIKLVSRHPEVEFAAAMDIAELEDKPVSEIHPVLRGIFNLNTILPDPKKMAALDLDAVFLCTPDKVSHQLVPGILQEGMRVIDFSGAFRLKNPASYPTWYGFEHNNVQLLSSAVYGLPEWNAPAIASAKLIANPGCYPTSVILALLPLVKAGYMNPGSDIFCDSKSGVTGAGRGAKQELMFSEISGSFRPYNPVMHRHAPEMCQEIGWDIDHYTFIPHLLPIRRGIISTIYVSFDRPMKSTELEEAYNAAYSRHRFVRILGAQKLPELRAVVATNFCDISWRLTHEGRRGVIFSAIDNLVKGASGQALQNFNLMHNMDETTGML